MCEAAAASKIPLFVIDSHVLRRTGNFSSLVQADGSAARLNTGFPGADGRPTPDAGSGCQLLCDPGRKVTHLASLSALVTAFQLLRLVERLRSAGLTCLELAADPTLGRPFDQPHAGQPAELDFGVRPASHLIVFDERQPRHRSFLVHLLLLDDLPSHQHWHSQPVYLGESEKRLIHRQGARKLHFQFGDHGQIYQK